jgi:hypothetical protein
MPKRKKVLKNVKIKPTKEKLVKPVETDKNDIERNEMSEYMALLETKYKPPPKLTKHENIFN